MSKQRRWRKAVIGLMLIGTALVGLTAVIVPRMNRYQVSGQIRLPGIEADIVIVRDEKGMPYIHAQSQRDLYFGQGFAAAQDRLFQMQLMLWQAQGRIAELAGDVARDSDIRMRTIGVHRLAKAHAAILDAPSREVFEAYIDGVNAFLDHCQSDLPFEFKVAGIAPQRWTVEDSLSILYLMSWDTSANIKHEVITQMLLDKLGPDRAAELLPINRNPDDTTSDQQAIEKKATSVFAEPLQIADDLFVQALLDSGDLQVGSNNWVTGPRLSSSGHAMVVGDPHLDPRMLPGIMYAVGYVLPDARAVGANVPGIPGFTIGRTEHIATAVTNNYGDAQDLYIETLDPQNSQNYLESGKSFPFRIERQTLKIKDKSAPDGFRQEDFEVRLTSRGPVVSDVLGIKTDKLLSLRWAAAENMQPQMGLTNLLKAKTVTEVDDALRTVTSIVLNFVFADSTGNIAWRATGMLPNRSSGGTAPVSIPSQDTWEDNWRGWIAFEEMPHQLNPQRGWLGTANHYTIDSNYPYYYSDFASPSYRYRRLKQRMDERLESGRQVSIDDHWSIQRDTKNLMSQSVVPKLVAALATDDRTAGLADVLREWDFHDDIDHSAPTVFQTVYCQLAKATFADELGEELTGKMLGNWYYWQERFESLVLDGTSHWFDDITTTEVTETLGQLIVRAGLATINRMEPQLGSDPLKWRWGDVHTLSFVNPLRRSGMGSVALGTGPMAAAGSGETLYRGWYGYDDPYHVTSTAALRMVVDFGDNEKVRAVVAGGTVARTFHPHQQDQVDAYMSGQPLHWWFSDQAIEAHATSKLTLSPSY